MIIENLTLLRCPVCNKSFSKTHTFEFSSAIIECDCGPLPVLDNIIYLQHNERAKKAVAFLLSNKYRQAFVALCDTPKRLSYLLWATRRLPKQNKAFFRLTIWLITILGYNRSWAWYIKNRKRFPTYQISLLSLQLLKKNHLYVDIGCGTGDLLESIFKKTKNTRLIGVDISFVTLLLARHFTVSNTTLLVCHEFTDKLPFAKNSVSLIGVNDSLQYIQKISLFVKDASRILAKNGSLAAFHIVNILEPLAVGGGIAPEYLEKLLKLNNFYPKFITNHALWNALINHKQIYLSKQKRNFFVDNAYGYSCIAFKSTNKFNILPTQKLPLQIVYTQDQQLLRPNSLPEFINHNTFVFLSPHFDDAILSCGALISWLRKMKKTVYIITLFTKVSSKPYSPQAVDFLNRCNVQNADKLFELRKKENDNVGIKTGIHIINLKFEDAAWRKNGNGFIYHNAEAQFSGKISSRDKNTQSTIEKEIKIITENLKSKYVLLAPLGIGGHADHVIARKIAKNFDNPVYWEDFPYNLDTIKRKKLFENNSNFQPIFDVRTKLKEKSTLIRLYSSQINLLFPNGSIPVVAEKYYS